MQEVAVVVIKMAVKLLLEDRVLVVLAHMVI
jgi:hypothetical protein